MSIDTASAKPLYFEGIAEHAQPLRVLERGLQQGSIGHISTSPEYLDTDLVDLAAVTLSRLRECNDELLTASLERLLSQVDRPRMIFSVEPPERVD